MPPAGVRRPEGKAAAEFVSFLETKIDAGTTVAAPGRVPLRRLNRREYQYAVRDLLGLNIDATAWLPDDNVKGNFDNNAAALQVSPNFIDQYIYAARAVAVRGDRQPQGARRDDHLRRRGQHGDLAAAGRRRRRRPPAAPHRGDAVRHARRLHGGAQLPGRRRIRADHRRHGAGARSAADGVREHGDRAAGRQGVLPHHHRRGSGPQGIDQKLDPAVEEINGRLRKIRFKTTAGQHKLGITFLHRSFAESDERTRTIGARGRPGAHPGGARAADPRAAVGDRHQPVGQPLEDLHLPAEELRAKSWPARTASSRTWRGAPSAARSPPRT